MYTTASVRRGSTFEGITGGRGRGGRATIIWLLLIVATVATWTLGEQGAAGPKVAGVLFAIAFLKGRAIALDFMGLKHAPLLWRLLAEGWLVLVCTLIGLAYWKGMTP